MKNILILLLFSQPLWAETPIQIQLKVEKYKLANGLTVLLHEDHSAPIVSYQTFFRVGSKIEPVGRTGISHLFEHMMFKGAKRYSGEEFDRSLQGNGGVNNAFTTHDYTGYYEDVPSSKLELVIDLDSDRMENLQVTAANLKSEREVVKEERRYRVDNDVEGKLMEVLNSLIFKVHPYGWPVIGWMKDIDAITLEDCQKFFKTYYAPNNAVLTVAGDFNSEKAKALIEKYYGKIAAQEIPKPVLPAEPPQKQQRDQTILKNVQNVTLAVSFQAPKSGEQDGYALDLVANIVGRGNSSRLYRSLVYNKQIANQVMVYNEGRQDAGVFTVFVSLKPGKSHEDALQAIYNELWKVRNTLVSKAELEKVKNQIMVDYVNSLKTIHGKAHLLALNETLFGDYTVLFKDLDRYRQVTAQDIKKVGEKYLNTWQRTIVKVQPTTKAAGQ